MKIINTKTMNDKHTFGNLVSKLTNHMHTLVNLWCDFPDHRPDTSNPQSWNDTKQTAFINTVLEKDKKRFDHDGQLNWTVNKKYLR
jgi:hypothetical protein